MRNATIFGLLVLFSCHHALADGSDADWQKSLDYIDTDDISPVSIEHNVDEVIAAGVVHQRYNYFDYRFEYDGAYILARSYIDDAESVSLSGPFNLEEKKITYDVDKDAFVDLVVKYMRRRYSQISYLKEGEGYVKIWSAAEDKK